MSTTVAPAGPAPTAPAPESPTRRSAKRVALIVLSRYGTLIGLAIMIIAFTVRAPTTFLTLPNFLNILNQSSLTAIIAAGLTMTLVVGEFDLSIGYVASFAGLLVVGFIARDGVPVLLALPLILL